MYQGKTGAKGCSLKLSSFSLPNMPGRLHYHCKNFKLGSEVEDVKKII